jgi:hypothetical protein
VELVVGKAVASARSEAGLRGVFVEVVGVVSYGMSAHDGFLVFRHWEIVVAVVFLALIVAVIFLVFVTPVIVLEKSIQGNIHLVWTDSESSSSYCSLPDPFALYLGHPPSFQCPLPLSKATSPHRKQKLPPHKQLM